VKLISKLGRLLSGLNSPF